MSRNKLYTYILVACSAGYFWFLINFSVSSGQATKGFGVCLFKKVTSVPCPSCGSTRSLVSLFQGNFTDAVYWNPLGFLLGLCMLILPVWVVYDLIRHKSSLLNFYLKSEKVISHKKVAIPAAALILINWIWNIYKGL